MKNKFEDKEISNLGFSICQYIFPRLVVFRENHIGYPSCIENPHVSNFQNDLDSEFYMKKWDDILDKMIRGFHAFLYEMNDWETIEDYNRINSVIDEGMNLFAEYIGCLYI